MMLKKESFEDDFYFVFVKYFFVKIQKIFEKHFINIIKMNRTMPQYDTSIIKNMLKIVYDIENVMKNKNEKTNFVDDIINAYIENMAYFYNQLNDPCKNQDSCKDISSKIYEHVCFEENLIKKISFSDEDTKLVKNKLYEILIDNNLQNIYNEFNSILDNNIYDSQIYVHIYELLNRKNNETVFIPINQKLLSRIDLNFLSLRNNFKNMMVGSEKYFFETYLDIKKNLLLFSKKFNDILIFQKSINSAITKNLKEKLSKKISESEYNDVKNTYVMALFCDNLLKNNYKNYDLYEIFDEISDYLCHDEDEIFISSYINFSYSKDFYLVLEQTQICIVTTLKMKEICYQLYKKNMDIILSEIQNL